MTTRPARAHARLPILLVGAALLTAFAVFALPAASAHDCIGNAGGAACGPCLPGQPHNHRSTSGGTFCSTSLRCELGVCTYWPDYF
jgi:hypothetical protein